MQCKQEKHNYQVSWQSFPLSFSEDSCTKLSSQTILDFCTWLKNAPYKTLIQMIIFVLYLVTDSKCKESNVS